jgi:hypothetical protein
METFLDPTIRKQQYSKLTDIPKIIKILEKFKEESRFLKRKGAKEKTLENIIAQLKKEAKL